MSFKHPCITLSIEMIFTFIKYYTFRENEKIAIDVYRKDLKWGVYQLQNFLPET